MSPAIHAAIAQLVDAGAQLIPKNILGPQARSFVDSFVVDAIRKNWPQAVQDAIGAMDIQTALDLHPDVPNNPVLVAAGTSGVNVVSSGPVLTNAELDRQMQANNDRLLAAMQRMITEQNAASAAKAPAQTPSTETKENN